MSLESSLDDLVDPGKRLSAQQLANLSDLDEDDARRLADEWQSIPPERRLRIVSELTDLAQDNVDLNFDAVFKRALRDEASDVRAAAIRGLHEYEGRDLIAVLAEILRHDPDAVVRREAAIALGRFALAVELGYLREGDAETVPDVLMESVEDLEEDDRVRARALEALGAVSGDETENLIESIYKEDSFWLKVGAVDAMGRSCSETWLPVVIREMENRAPEMRHAAAFAAGEIGDEEAVQPLKRLAVEDPDREVQLVAIHALGEIGGNRARVALKSVLYEGDDSLREAVEEAMTSVAFDEDPLRPGGL